MPTVYPKLNQFIKDLDLNKIGSNRQKQLNQLAEQVNSALNQHNEVNMIFICTHNSRRSHLTQIWAQCMAAYYGIDGIHTFSGGTEATAVYPTVIDVLEHAGFHTQKENSETQPIYDIAYSEYTPAITAFSKVYDDDANPQKGYIAIMTCDQANETCPFTQGETARVALTYVDPKISDGTSDELRIYTERSTQIAREMSYIFQKIKNK